LLGLFRASQGLKGKMFDQTGISLDRARVEMIPNPTHEPIRLTDRVLPSDRVREVFRAAADEADLLKQQDIGLVHILIGVLRGPDSIATRLLERMDIRLQSVRHRLALLLNEEPL
jgi:ATP-dependent Clp protease ATP-binding subunit ClpA